MTDGADGPEEAVLDLAVDPSALLEDGGVVAANPEFRDVVGAEADDLEGAPVESFVEDVDPDRLVAGEVDDERGTVQRDGETRQVAVASASAPGDSNRTLVRLRDVTDEVATREELERKRAMFDALMENAPVAIYFKDREARHVRASQHVVDYLSETDRTRPDGTPIETEADVIGLTDLEIYGPETSSYEDDLRVIEEGVSIVGKEEVSEHPDSDQWIETTKVPWYDEDGEIQGLVGVTYSITAEKRSERLEEFARIVAHDIRNPLAVAAGQLEIAAEEGGGEHVAAARRAVDRIEELVDEVLERARQGRVVEDPESVDLHETVTAAWESIGARATAASLDADDVEDYQLVADRQRLIELLENLFRNCVDHGSTSPRSASGDGKVDVTVGRLEDGVGFYVADDGPGIPPEQRAEVFERGFTTRDEGSGLGLLIVDQIASAHGWNVDVTESQSGGARFEVSVTSG